LPRIRYLKPEFFLDEDLSYLTVEARLTFQGLWCHADREGRLEDRPAYLKTQIWPYQEINPTMDELLNELAKPKTNDPDTSFILRYTINKKKYIQIIKFLDHQKPHHTERKSTIPPPLTVNSPLEDGGYPMGMGSRMGKKIYGKEKEKENGEVKGTGEKEGKKPESRADDGGNGFGALPPPAPHVDPMALKAQAELIRKRAELGIHPTGRRQK
jgi:hypothetical protein